VNAPARSESAEVSSAEAVPEICKQNNCCRLLPWVAVEIPLPLSKAQWEWRIHKSSKSQFMKAIKSDERDSNNDDQ
jgi:hypothetical protein